ncbi:MAG: RIP metalloprotease RseP, partial [Bacteroidetes bacterium QS_9_68_14]
LDGGHLMFLLYEGVTRRRPSEKVRMVMQQIGFVVLIVFMAFVIFNDILRL